MTPTIILWIYITLLIVGGMMGFLKAKSKVSLYMSLGFAAALSLCATHILPHRVADLLLILLLIVFGIRLIKTKKLMPAGMMLIVTLLALTLSYLS